MHVETFSLPHAWFRRTAAYLTRHEAENNLLLGLAHTLMNDPGAYAEYYMGTVVEDDAVVGAALMTVPYNLILSHTEHPDALEALAANVVRTHRTLPGVNGRKDLSHTFARLWTVRTGQPHELEMEQRVYQLREVKAPAGAAGSLRPAEASDIDLIADWMYDFAIDAHLEADRERSRIAAERAFRTKIRRTFFWVVDGEPVCMVGATGPTPNGIRIGPVYTPAAQRRKGYGSACTAAVSQQMLSEGRTYCFLFTDTSNPTSNKIYQEIGYEPVCDTDLIKFRPTV